MRVLHVSAYFAPAFGYGGPPRSILGLCRGLSRAGVDVRVFTTTADGDCELPASGPAGSVYEGIPIRYFPRRFPRRYWNVAGLGEALRAEAPAVDLLHLHGLWHVPAWTAGRVARALGIPYVLSPRGMLQAGSLAHRSWRKRLVYGWTDRANVEGAAFLHATSEEEARELSAWTRAPIVTIPNGVEIPAARVRRDVRSACGIPPDAPIVLFLGRLHPIKRLDLLARAFARLLTQRPDAHLAIVGPDEGGYRARVAPLFASSAEHVHWAGAVDEESRDGWLGEASVLVLCSDSENFGMVVAEGLAAGVPAVVTRTCPWGTLIDADAGCWVDQRDGAIAEALAALLANPAEARAKGARGRALVEREYGWDAIARRMKAEYARVLADRGRSR